MPRYGLGAHQELIDYMSRQYQSVPANLEKTLHSVIERLEEGKIIQLSEKAFDLPYYLASPIEELDIEKAKSLIKEDEQTRNKTVHQAPGKH